MKPKTILSIAILLALPLTANADNPVVSVGPAAVPSNGTAVVATANPPYQTLTPTNDDKSHIASTAYVKGAYNDAIAAVNKLDNTKQDQLYNENNTKIAGVMGGDDFQAMTDDVVRLRIIDGENISSISSGLENYAGNMFVTAAGATEGILAAAEVLNEQIGAVDTKIDNKRVEIYTTWDNDNATKQVAFVTASAQSGQ